MSRPAVNNQFTLQLIFDAHSHVVQSQAMVHALHIETFAIVANDHSQMFILAHQLDIYLRGFGVLQYIIKGFLKHPV
ncbi:hypothetical protein DSECCO2_631070 [anaerobic digester metagenome]